MKKARTAIAGIVDWKKVEDQWVASVCKDAKRAYRRALTNFTSWAAPESVESSAGLRMLCQGDEENACDLLLGWRDSLLGMGRAPGTVAGQVSAIASLLRICRKAGIITFAIEGVAPRRARVQDRRGPSRSEVERLLAHIDKMATAGDVRAVRDAAIVRLLYCCAMRRGEVAGLRIEDVNLTSLDVSPKRSAARKPIGISRRTAKAIARWMAIRGSEPGALFHRLDRAGDLGHLSGESIRHLLKQRAAAAGIKGVVRPHGLRHSSASELARCGSLDELMSLCGWKSLSSANACLGSRDSERASAMRRVDA